MKFNKITLLLAIMIISILAVGAVSAESVDDATISADDSDLTVATADSDINDVSAADDAADDAVGDDGNAVLGDDAASYDLDDDSYSTYFNEDGTATDALSEMGDYTLNVGTLTNKDIKIASGSNINITGKDGAGFINNGTITIGDGAGNAGSIIISGLTFTNTNKNAVEILDLSSDITIKGNTMNIEGVAPEDNPYFSIYGVNANGYISGLKIEDNTISVKGNAPYSYGIQLGSYGAISNPENIVISNNAIYVNVEDCMAEAIYLDNPNNVLIEANNVTVANTGDNCAYGIQVADSAQSVFYYAGYEGALTSPRNVLIKDNNLDVSSDFMVYALTVISFGADGYDEDMAEWGYSMPACYQFDLNTTIANNTVVANSKKGVIGIGGQTYNMTVVGNDVTAIGISAENMTTGDALRNHTSAICVQYNGANADDDYFIVVNDNKITTNVIPEEINSKDYLGYVTFKNNNRTLIVDDVEYTVVDADNYAQFFDESGEYINDVENIALGDFEGKSLVFGSKVNVVGVPGSKLTNVNIDLTADGIVIDGLTFEFEGVPGGWNGLIHVGVGAKDITISNNNIKIVGTGTGTVYAIVIPGSNDSITENIAVTGNVIDITGENNKYLYAVDAFSYDYPYKGVSSKNLTITGNNVTLKGSTNMAEAFYVSGVDDSIVSDNIVFIESTANAYGIGSDNVNNVVFSNNAFDIKSTSDTGASYGITIAPGKGVTANDNTITVEGVSAIGIGLTSGSDAVLNGNVINVAAGDYSSLTPSTSIGVGDEEIKLNDNTDAVVNGTEYKIADGVTYIVFDGVDHVIVDADNYDQFFDESGNYISDFENIALDDLSDKALVFGSKVNVKGVPGAKLTNVNVDLTADGIVIDGLTFEFEGVPGGWNGLIHVGVGAKDITISNNNIKIVGTGTGTVYAIVIPGSNDSITENIAVIGNVIDIVGETNEYVYAVDAFSYDYPYKGVSSKNLTITGNNVTLKGSTNMAEAFYVSGVDDSIVSDNIVFIESTANAYGIGSDNVNNVVFNNNEFDIKSTSDTGASYGITIAPGKGVTANDNTITVEGVSAIGIGLASGSDAVLNGNIIDVTAGDYSTLTPSTSVGVGNEAIKLNDNTNAVINGTEYKIADGVTYIVFDGVDHVIVDADNYDQFFDESGNYINEAEGIALDNASNKNLTFASPVSVVGVPDAKLTNVTIKLTADASGSSIDGLTIVYEGADLSYYHGIIDIMGGAKDIALTNNVINVTATNEDGTAMAIYLSGNIGEDLISNITISGNEINVDGTARYLYAVDAISNNWGSDDAAVTGIDAYDNIINLEGTYYVAGFYLSHTADSNIHDNVINGVSTGADGGVAYGIASDCASKMIYDNNIINLEAASDSSTVYGIQAAPSYYGTPSTDITITNNDVTVSGASAIGIGINGGNSTIKDNTIEVTAADNESVNSIIPMDTVGTGNSGVKLTGNATSDVSGNYISSNQNNMDLAGAGSDTKIGTNYVTEYVEKEGNPDLPAAPKATSITVQSATVTADPNGKSKTQNIAITVKDANGNPVAGQTIQVYVNGALKTAKTNDKGVATLAVPYKAGGTVSLVASFNGAAGLLGSSATGKLTVKKNAVKIAAKTKKVKKSKAKKAKVKFTLKVGKTALKKKAVTIKINKKTYKAKTNAKGIVTFKVKLPKKAKKYKYTVKFAGDNFNKAKTFKGKLTVK